MRLSSNRQIRMAKPLHIVKSFYANRNLCKSANIINRLLLAVGFARRGGISPRD
jgi:hypothetical protein